MASWKKSKVVGIVAVVIAVIAIGFVIYYVSKPTGTEMTLINTKTGKVFKKLVLQGTEFPIASESGEKVIYQAQHYRCKSTDKEGYLPMKTGEQAMTLEGICPGGPDDVQLVE